MIAQVFFFPPPSDAGEEGREGEAGTEDKSAALCGGEKNEGALNWLGGVMEDEGEKGARGDGDG